MCLLGCCAPHNIKCDYACRLSALAQPYALHSSNAITICLSFVFYQCYKFVCGPVSHGKNYQGSWGLDPNGKQETPRQTLDKRVMVGVQHNYTASVHSFRVENENQKDIINDPPPQCPLFCFYKSNLVRKYFIVSVFVLVLLPAFRQLQRNYNM